VALIIPEQHHQDCPPKHYTEDILFKKCILNIYQAYVLVYMIFYSATETTICVKNEATKMVFVDLHHTQAMNNSGQYFMCRYLHKLCCFLI